MSLADELVALVRAAVRDELRAAGASTAPTPDGYMSPERAAALCEVTPDTVREWVRAGKLTGYRAGRLLRVSRAELEAFLRRPAAESPDDDLAFLRGVEQRRRR